MKVMAAKGNVASAEARKVAAAKRGADLLPVIEVLRGEGVNSLTGISEKLNERGISAPRGGKWSPTQVSRVLKSVAKPTRARRIALVP
jgi:hypothetical protein